MTANQIAYLAHLETSRSNLAKEKETERSNLAKEAETYRSNLATEADRNRQLAETKRSNSVNEYLKSQQNLETERSNLAKEKETRRHNYETESETFRDNLAQANLKDREIYLKELSNPSDIALTEQKIRESRSKSGLNWSQLATGIANTGMKYVSDIVMPAVKTLANLAS